MSLSTREAANPITFSVSEQKGMRKTAMFVIFIVTVFTALFTVLQIPAIAPYPGVGKDFIMISLSFFLPVGLCATTFKAIEVKLLGKFIERQLGIEQKLGQCRSVSIGPKAIFHKEIRTFALVGGSLQAFYQIAFLLLVTTFSPAALASARSLVILALGVLELGLGILPRTKTIYIRLAISVFITLIGASIIAFANGISLFQQHANINPFFIGVFFFIIGPGNVLLGIAEIAEFKGAHTRSISTATYTLSRFVFFTITSAICAILWGVTHNNLPVLLAITQMCIARWYILVPLAMIGGLADLLRIACKPIVSSTFMYVVGSLSVAFAAVIQEIAFLMFPSTFKVVPGGIAFAIACLIGAIIISYGTIRFPHATETNTSVEKG